MKGFTLIEIAFIILLISSVVAIGFSFLSFNRTFFYLRDIGKNFNFALYTISDMSQRLIKKNSDFYCAYGIYFPSSTSYEVLAFSTSTDLCEYIFVSSTIFNNFIDSNISLKRYILQNQQISSTSVPSLSLNINLKPNSYFSFSTSSKDCTSNLITPPLVFIYGYGYNELFFLYQRNERNWIRVITDKIYICLGSNYLNERYTIKVNKLGQVSFEK